MTKNEIETTGTSFDVIAAITNDAITNLTFHTLAALATLDRLSNLYSSVHPTNVWNENDDVREARRISSEIKTVIDNLQNTEGLTDELLDREIDRLNSLHSSVHPTNVWNENDDVREARRISSDVEFIKNKLISEVEFIKNELINIKISIHEINAYY